MNCSALVLQALSNPQGPTPSWGPHRTAHTPQINADDPCPVTGVPPSPTPRFSSPSYYAAHRFLCPSGLAQPRTTAARQASLLRPVPMYQKDL